MANILIGADICPIGRNLQYFKQGDAARLFGDLLVELGNADLTIANLECPLINDLSPLSKTGPTFGEGSECINGIKQSGIKVLCIANNHIMDHGPKGLENTMGVCAEAGISTVGAGRNLAEARRILVREIGKLRVGILAVAEHEFSIASKNSWGANPLDLIDIVRNVNASRKEFDYLIVLLHGGDEFLVPSPRIKNTCHFLVEIGANAVIVQHPHCVGGYEEYLGSHIVYGQGALIMDEAIYRDVKSFHEGFLVKLNIADDATSRMEVIPYVQSDPAPGARRMEKVRERDFLGLLAQKSRDVQNDDLVASEWLRFCDQRKHGYLSALLGHNRVISKVNSRGFLTKFAYTARPLLRVRNIVCCETHREAIETIFSNRMI